MEAHSSGALTASVKALNVRRQLEDPAWTGQIQFEVTVANGTAEDIFLVDGLTMPYFDATTSPSSTLTIHWDVADWRDDISSRPHVFEIPKTKRLAAGTSHTRTVWVSNPVPLTNHDMVFWDETTTPPTDVDPADVLLTAPITVGAVIGYGLEDFVLTADRQSRNAFQAWQQRLLSATTTLVGQ